LGAYYFSIIESTNGNLLFRISSDFLTLNYELTFVVKATFVLVGVVAKVNFTCRFACSKRWHGSFIVTTAAALAHS
jgi:hypothetical protein